MMMGSFLFKQKARQVLRSNWQTALVVTFFSGIFLTISQVVQSVGLADVQSVMSSLSFALESVTGSDGLSLRQRTEVADLYRRLFGAIEQVPTGMWVAMIALNVLAMVITPALTLSCNRYFICLNDGQDVGVHEGLMARLPQWRRALWLYVQMYVRIFLWSLLLFIPGVVAALRYSQAPYYLAEDPSLTAGQAIQKSKETMQGKKSAYFLLLLSFVGWSLLLTMADALLAGLLGAVAAMVAGQFLSLALNVYINASCAAFYGAVSRPQGMDEIMGSLRSRLREMGMDEDALNQAGLNGEDPEDENGSDGGEE